ncbi:MULTISPECIES: hypothetical protein [Micromonospora]|uniref:Uncharacterized protein n=2 Tax=Micromonospora TaxID=1873 RepID=A0A1C6RLU8_9ACTN|nr:MULTISPECIES: hypothetical protein [Micromonospora]TWJ31505.1 hypothetical protein JD81_05062 [Micromonospora sagamiensis]BCL15447.1 hypothetical protein GCM10017556_31860 [Micromonospora sagamiensis]SCL18148.1 hypothetical protein GA0074694_2256 [Micromonospora inyonensis]
MLTVAPPGPDFETTDPDEEPAAEPEGRHRLILAYIKALSPIIAAMVASIGTLVTVLAR